MAAAAYAALLSLIHTIETIHHHPTLSISFNTKQYDSLYTNTNLLIKFLESYSSGGGQDLKSQIRDKASLAECIIEAFVRDHIDAQSKGENFIEETPIISSLSLDKVIEDLSSIVKETTKFEETAKGNIVVDQLPTSTISEDLLSIIPPITGKNTMVGFEDKLDQIIEMLIRGESSRRVIPIVGMGGSGKTLLAKNVYENIHILQHFESLAWFTISQVYNVREILLETLSCLGTKNENGTIEELGLKVHKSLWKRRYLIVMDDMWDINVWDEVSRYYPDDNNGSRILVTTRDSNLSSQFNSLEIQMNFLDENKSWNLFCQKTFHQGVCPPEDEEIGKEIVRSCKGLPLSIVVVGGLIRKSEEKKKLWEYVANGVKSDINLGDDERCMKILSLSYHHLPIHLKPCFLFFGVFHEDEEIRVSELVKLWIVEGFLKQNETKNLKEVGKGYLKDLISRNLILVHERGRTGNVKLCKIHDVLRDLCLKEAQKEKFIYIPEVHSLDSLQGLISESGIFRTSHIHIPELCRECSRIHCKVYLTPKSISRACSSIRDLNCTWPVDSFKLLRKLEIQGTSYMLDHHSCKSMVLSDDISQLINSRYLFLNIYKFGSYQFSFSISLLWNLQILIVKKMSLFVSEFWEMSQLRHLDSKRIHLPDPSVGQKDVIVLKNLQTLNGIVNFKFCEEAVKRIPNIKKLKLKYGWGDDCEAAEEYCLENIGLLRNLESLSIIFPNYSWPSDTFQLISFPTSLKKMYLECCDLDWKNITTIGSLPHLELLATESCKFEGLQSEACDEQFQQLKYLRIFDGGGGGFINGEWKIDESYFPCLAHLSLSQVEYNKEIFSGIGEICTLHTVELIWCSSKVVESAKKMQEEQEENGNDGLVIHVQLWEKDDYEDEDKDLMSLASPNFRIKYGCSYSF